MSVEHESEILMPSDGGVVHAARLMPWTKLLIGLVTLYQRAAAGRPSPCRFTPSCSTYASEALRAHGSFKGLYLALRRLIRCNPWGGQGFDPVPQHRSPKHRSSQHRSQEHRSSVQRSAMDHNHNGHPHICVRTDRKVT